MPQAGHPHPFLSSAHPGCSETQTKLKAVLSQSECELLLLPAFPPSVIKLCCCSLPKPYPSTTENVSNRRIGNGARGVCLNTGFRVCLKACACKWVLYWVEGRAAEFANSGGGNRSKKVLQSSHLRHEVHPKLLGNYGCDSQHRGNTGI